MIEETETQEGGEGGIRRARLHMHQSLGTFCPQYYVIKQSGMGGGKKKAKRKEAKEKEKGKEGDRPKYSKMYCVNGIRFTTI